MKHIGTAIFTVMLLGAALLCADEPPAPPGQDPGPGPGPAAGPQQPPTPQPPAAGDAATAAAFDADPIAVVCGQPIARKVLLDRLLAKYGEAALEELVNRSLAEQEIKRLGAVCSPAEIEERIALQVKLSEEEVRRETQGKATLQQFLTGKGETLDTFKAALRASDEFRLAVAIEKIVRFLEITEERVEVQHILVPDEAKAKKLRENLGKGADFARVAAQDSEDTLSAIHGGKLKPFVMGFSGMGFAFDHAAFALKEGELSEPLQSEQGFHLLRVIRRIPGRAGTFEELKAEAWQAVLREPVSKRDAQLWLMRLRELYKDKVEVKVARPAK